MNPDDDDEGSETVLTLERPVQDDTDDTASAAESTDLDDAPRRAPRLLIRIAAAVLAAAVTAALVVLAIGEYHHRHDDALRAQAVTSAHDYLTAMAAFDYQNMDANRDRIVSSSSPEFAAKYDEMVKALRDIVVTSKGVATATADHVVVERMDGTSATVIAFVDQHVTNVTAPQGSEQKYRMVVTFIRDGDRWIVNDVQTV